MPSFTIHYPFTDITAAIQRQHEPFSIHSGKKLWAIGLRKQDITLLQAINKFLREFKDTGGFEKLGEQFLPEEKAYFKANDIPFYF